jgi:hypothetical protein
MGEDLLNQINKGDHIQLHKLHNYICDNVDPLNILVI